MQKIPSANPNPQNQKIDTVLVAMRRIIRATDLHSHNLIKITGLTIPQLLLMRSIQANDEVTIGELARDISLSQATVTSILDRLEKRELVYRQKSTQDKRKVHAYLTRKGKAAVKKAPAPLQEGFILQFTKLEDWEQNMIISSLQRIAAMMDADHIVAAPVLDVGQLDKQELNFK